MQHLRGLRDGMPSGCFLGFAEETGAGDKLSGRVLALQCVCAGLSRRGSDKHTAASTDVYVL